MHQLGADDMLPCLGAIAAAAHPPQLMAQLMLVDWCMLESSSMDSCGYYVALLTAAAFQLLGHSSDSHQYESDSHSSSDESVVELLPPPPVPILQLHPAPRGPGPRTARGKQLDREKELARVMAELHRAADPAQCARTLHACLVEQEARWNAADIILAAMEGRRVRAEAALGPLEVHLNKRVH